MADETLSDQIQSSLILCQEQQNGEDEPRYIGLLTEE